MSYCRRARTSGGSYFFTVVTYRRQPLLIHPESRRILGEVIQRIRQGYVTHVANWQYSIFHHDVKAGLYPELRRSGDASTFEPTDFGE